MLLPQRSPHPSSLEVPHLPDGRRRSSSGGLAEAFTSYHIISNVKSNCDTIEIQQKGRTALLAKTSQPLIGSALMELRTPKVDGRELIASSKLKSHSMKFKVIIGTAKDAQTITCTRARRSTDNEPSTVFEHKGNAYVWRTPKVPPRDPQFCSLNPLSSDTADGVKAFQMSDLELVSVVEDDTVLARFCNDATASDVNDDAKLEFMANLGPELEVLCLTSILSVQELAMMEMTRPSMMRKFRARTISDLRNHKNDT